MPRGVGRGAEPPSEDLAEGEGFEPPIPCGIPVFKTGAFNRSATPPTRRGTQQSWVWAGAR